jgi:hypothetical protein
MANTRPNPKVLALVMVVHVLVTAFVWKDIDRRPAQAIRGSKGLWRFLTALNTSHSLVYLLVGIRRRSG